MPLQKNIPTENYTAFAALYDDLMEHVDYPNWFAYLDDLFSHFSLPKQTLLEIGAGTGAIAAQFAKREESIDLLDISGDMLAEAKKKNELRKAHFYKMDILKKVPKAVYSSAFCLHDTINYFKNPVELEAFFNNCSKIIQAGGGLILDNCSIYCYKKYFHKKRSKKTIGDTRVVWKNHFEKPNLGHSVLSFKKENSIRSEHHTHILHSDSDILKASEQYFDNLAILDGFTLNPRHNKTEEIYYVFRRK